MPAGQTKESCRWLLSAKDDSTLAVTFVGQTKNACGTVSVFDTAVELQHAQAKAKAKAAKAKAKAKAEKQAKAKAKGHKK